MNIYLTHTALPLIMDLSMINDDQLIILSITFSCHLSPLPFMVVGTPQMASQQCVSTLLYLPTALTESPNSSPVQSFMLLSHLFLCLSLHCPLHNCLCHAQRLWRYDRTICVCTSSLWKGDRHACRLHPVSYYEPPH